jgi:MscS family membrane protein
MCTDWINIGITFLIAFVSLFLITQILLFVAIRIARRTPTKYDEIYLRSIKPQINLLVLLISIKIATPRLLFVDSTVRKIIDQIIFALFVLVIAIIIWKLIDFLVLWYKDLAERSGHKDFQEAALNLAQRTGHIVVIIVGILLILDNFGVNVSAMITALGVGGLAISLAARETLSNMISGIMILMDQPFRIGDRVEIQGLNTWGDVMDVGLRSTRIQTRDNRMVIVPNANISNNQVINYTYPDPKYRMQIDVGVGYGTDLTLVRKVIAQAVQGIEGVLVDKPVDVILTDFTDTKLTFRVRWWIESYTETRRILDRVNEVIYQSLKNVNIQTTSSTTTVESRKL